MSVAASAKAALLGEDSVLKPLLPSGVKISYSPPRDVLREVVYGASSVTGPVELKAMAGGDRVKRSEDLATQIAVRVWRPGEKSTEATDARAVEIGDVIALYIAANWTLGLEELKKAAVTNVDLDGWVDDDGAGSVLTLTVGLMSYLT